MSSDMEGKMQSIYDSPQPSLTEALARSLRDLMQINGRPSRSDFSSPGYRADPGLYEDHLRKWDQAKDVLSWFEREQLKPQ